MRGYVAGYRGFSFSKDKRFPDVKPNPNAKTKHRKRKRIMARKSKTRGKSKSQNSKTGSDKKSSKLPGVPEEDNSGNFFWEIVDINCGNYPSEGFSLTGKSHITGDHRMWARKQKPLRAEPISPEEDLENRYEWCGVCTKTVLAWFRAPEGFRLTGAMIGNGHHMWARKLLSSNPQ